MNPRVAMNDLSVFKTDLFDHLSTPPSKNYEIVWKMRFRQSFRQSAKKHSNPFLRGKKVKRDKGFQKSSSELTTLFSKDRLVVTASIPLRMMKECAAVFARLFKRFAAFGRRFEIRLRNLYRNHACCVRLARLRNGF